MLTDHLWYPGMLKAGRKRTFRNLGGAFLSHLLQPELTLQVALGAELYFCGSFRTPRHVMRFSFQLSNFSSADKT